jgi:hypothetical protein
MTPSRLTAAAFALALFAAGAASAQPAGGGAVRQACMADFQKACPSAKPGPGGGMRECARDHFKEFSQPCQSALQAMRARMQQQQNSNSAPAAGSQ